MVHNKVAYQDGSQWSMASGIPACIISPIGNHAWLPWPIEYCGSEGVGLLSLGYKYFHLPLSWIGYSSFSQLSGCEHPQEVLRRGLCRKGLWSPTNNQHQLCSHGSRSSSPVRLLDDLRWLLVSWLQQPKRPSAKLPTNPLLDSCPIETVTDNKCLLLF